MAGCSQECLDQAISRPSVWFLDCAVLDSRDLGCVDRVVVAEFGGGCEIALAPASGRPQRGDTGSKVAFPGFTNYWSFVQSPDHRDACCLRLGQEADQGLELGIGDVVLDFDRRIVAVFDAQLCHSTSRRVCDFPQQYTPGMCAYVRKVPFHSHMMPDGGAS